MIAESWGIPPWEVIGHDPPTSKERLTWILRQAKFNNLRAEKQNEDITALTV